MALPSDEERRQLAMEFMERFEALPSQEKKQMAAALKAHHVLMDRPGLPCQSATCLLLATKRVYWPVTPGEAWPLYCDRCAAWAIQVLGALGSRVHVEDLPPLLGAVRGIGFGEV